MKRFRFIVFLLITGIICLLPSCSPREGRVAKQCRYFPVQNGNKWVYKGYLTVRGKSGSAKPDVVTKITGKEKVGFTECVVYKMFVGGKPWMDHYYEVSDKGIFLHKMVLTASGKNRGKKFNIRPPLPMLKVPLISGDTWSTSSGTETYKGVNKGKEYEKTSMGKFLTYKSILTISDRGKEKVKFTVWYAEDVGIVREIMDLNGVKISMNLKKYTVDGLDYPDSKGHIKKPKEKKTKAKKTSKKKTMGVSTCQ